MTRRARLVDPPISCPIGTGRRRKLVLPYEFYLVDCVVRIPIGAVWDQASVPRALRWLVDARDLGDAATLIHDIMYQWEGRIPETWCTPPKHFTRAEADVILRDYALLEGCEPWRVSVALAGVRSYWWTMERLGKSRRW